MFDDSMMLNPASKIHQKPFLKRTSVGKTTDSDVGPKKKLTHKAVGVKKSKRSLSSSQSKIIEQHRRYMSTAVGTENGQISEDFCPSERIHKLQQQNQSLKLQLKIKKTQMIQLNLKYLAIKQKMCQMDKSHKLSLPEFDDVSCISSCNSISRINKKEQLAAIKSRLKKLQFLTNQQNMPKNDNILPKDL